MDLVRSQPSYTAQAQLGIAPGCGNDLGICAHSFPNRQVQLSMGWQTAKLSMTWEGHNCIMDSKCSTWLQRFLEVSQLGRPGNEKPSD